MSPGLGDGLGVLPDGVCAGRLGGAAVIDSGAAGLLFGLVAVGMIYAMPLGWRRFAGGLLVLATLLTAGLQAAGVL